LFFLFRGASEIIEGDNWYLVPSLSKLLRRAATEILRVVFSWAGHFDEMRGGETFFNMEGRSPNYWGTNPYLFSSMKL